MIQRHHDDLLVWAPRTPAFKPRAAISTAVDRVPGLTTTIGDRRTPPPGYTPTGR